MRSLGLFLVVGLLAPSHLSAQELQDEPGKLGFAVGLTQSESAKGLTARAMYSPLGVERPLSVRLEAGFRWTPTYRLWASAPLINSSHDVPGEAQGADLAVGVTGVLSPSPKGQFSPYVIGGVVAVQEWHRTQGSSSAWSSRPGVLGQSWSGNSLHLVGGLGLRARILGHSFQLEARRYNYTTAVTVGSSLRF